MPRKHNKLMGLIRSFIPKNLAKYGAPFLGNAVVRGSELVKKLVPSFSGIVDSVTHHSLDFLSEPDNISSLIEVFDEPEPSPYATVPSNRDAYKSVNSFGKNPRGLKGDGQILFGSDQPVVLTRPKPPPVARPGKTKYVMAPMDGFNSWQQPNYNRVANNAAQVGGPFRKVGPGTNIQREAKGFGQAPPRGIEIETFDKAAAKAKIKAKLKAKAAAKGDDKPKKSKGKKKPLKIVKARL